MSRGRQISAALAALIAAAVMPSARADAPEETLEQASARIWNSIRDDTFEKHSEFVAGLKHCAANLDSEMHDLDAKRAHMSDSAAKDWDFEMRDLRDAQADLAVKIDDLGKASAEKWDDAKEKASTAWQRTQDDLDSVKASTTS